MKAWLHDSCLIRNNYLYDYKCGYLLFVIINFTLGISYIIFLKYQNVNEMNRMKC